MKNTSIYAILFLLLTLASCNGKTNASLQNQSPNGKVNVTVQAERVTTLESWKIQITVKAYQFKEGSLKLELYADDVNEDNVQFDWRDDANCIITFTANDGRKRTFHLIATPDKVQMGEV